MKIQLFRSLEEEQSFPSREFDMSLPKSPVCSSPNTELCAEFIEGPLSEKDSKFFAELLVCDLAHESIVDVLLVSNDDRLLWIKYSGSFREESHNNNVIDTIATTKGIIRGIKYYDGSLLLLDGITLSIFYLCSSTNIIRKKEIILDGVVKCFRFHHNQFIYSNLKKVIIVDFTNPQHPMIDSVNLKGIVCFTIVENLNFIIAICYNQLFYYVSMDKRTNKQANNKSDFQDLQANDIETIPSVAKFIDREEVKLLKIEQKIKELQNLKILLLHRMKSKDFVAGEATVKFYQTLPAVTGSSIVCKVTDQKAGSEFIELRIELTELLENYSFTIFFHRESTSGKISRAIKFDNTHKVVHIVMPAELMDSAKNKMSIDLNFTYEIKKQTKLIVFPVTIKKVIPFVGPRIKMKNCLDECLHIVDKMKM